MNLTELDVCGANASAFADHRFPATSAPDAPEVRHTVRGLPILGVVLSRIRNNTLDGGATRANYGMALAATRVVRVDAAPQHD